MVNQGTVTGSNFSETPTDDPDTGAVGDTTITPLTAAPVLSATKRDSVFVDADNNGVPSPGDTLLYQVVIRNIGNIAATGIVFADTLDKNTKLVVGSVQTTAGIVTQGNTTGDTKLAVAVGTLPGSGGTATISFRVIVNDPLLAGVVQVANQGTVSSDQLPVLSTDDPDTAANGDKTATPLTAAPLMRASKEDSLFSDADGNGVASPGDTIQFRITVVNDGNIAASTTFVDDLLDANTALTVGSVQISQGTVTKGNNPGDTVVQVDAGTIPGGGGTVTITYRVIIDNPLPAGVISIADQAIVRGGNFPATVTDDPATSPADDATVVLVTAAPILAAAKRDSVFTDADGNGVPSPGDTLLYQIRIDNTGNQAATGIVFNDTPGANTTLVVGSVQTGQGNVIIGNSAGDTRVRVNIGTIPGAASVTLSFRVVIVNPLPQGVTQVVNQGTVSSDQLPIVSTNDPDTAANGDKTATPVTAAPLMQPSKASTLLVDADNNGAASPGDTLLYRVTIANDGNQNATTTFLDDQLDVNTTLVVGSVQVSAGTVISGNTAGDSLVKINVGTIPGGSAVTISYQVTVNNPLPAGVTQVKNQGIVSGGNFPSTPTDDPATPADGDPTLVPVTAAPILGSTKADSLFTDVNGNGQADPGDTLLYQVRIANTGNQAATGVAFEDTPDANTTLVIGSVQRSSGTVILGNSADNTRVAVTIGNIPGGAAVTMSYRVTVNNPLPAGVSQIRNQGRVSSNELPVMLTDDPAAAGTSDPTVTPITAAPRLAVTKADSLLVDADNNGVPSPGDTLLYRVVVVNSGNQAATNVVVDDLLDPNTKLVVGSVQSDRGTVARGNSAGDTSLLVNVGTLPGGGGTAVITFRITVNNPLPAGVTQVANVALVRADTLPTTPSDDPDTPARDDATITPVTSAPALSLTKRDSLFTDADGNGVPSPGDTLLYQIQIVNRGNAAATGVILNDTPRCEYNVGRGPVQTDRGTVTSGNSGGNAAVAANRHAARRRRQRRCQLPGDHCQRSVACWVYPQ